MMRTTMATMAVTALLAGWPGALQANLISNGSFETPAVTPGNYLNIAAGGEAAAGFTAWTIGSGDIDIVNLTAELLGINWATPAMDGDQILDLHGFTQGSIYQDFFTVAGESYDYQFWLSDNPVAGGSTTAAVRLKDVATDATLETNNVVHQNATSLDPDWRFVLGSFTATGSLTRIIFESTSPGNGASDGVFLDAVEVNLSPVQAVPEPASLVLISTGLASFVGARCFRRIRRTGKPGTVA